MSLRPSMPVGLVLTLFDKGAMEGSCACWLRPKSKEELNAELCGDAEQIVARVENYSCSEEDAARRAAELEEVFRSVEE